MASNTGRLSVAHDAFNARGFEAAAKGLLEESGTVTDHSMGATFGGQDEFAQWQRDFVAWSSDTQIVNAEYIEADDYAIAMYQTVGTQDGPMGPFPASGESFSLDVCEVWHFATDGLADEGHIYYDGLRLLMQLGHIAPPSE